jgi:hypothetical protein
MDVAELRKRIQRALEEARREAATRRSRTDAAVAAYEKFLRSVAVPLFKQTATILNADGGGFEVNTPADGVRLSSRSSPETYVELALEHGDDEPEVVGRVSLTRGRLGVVVDERPVAPGRPIETLTEEDLASYLVAAVPRLLVR